MAGLHEQTLSVGMFGWALYSGALIWVMYLGLEPYVRRHWPSTLVAWSRLLAGRWRDPLVGRDVLIGVTFCLAGAVFAQAGRLLPALLGRPAEWLWEDIYDPFLGPRYVWSNLLTSLYDSIFLGLVTLFLLFLARALSRSQVAAIVTLSLLYASNGLLSAINPAITAVPILLANATMVIVLARVGLLAAIANMLTLAIVPAVVLVAHVSAWYWGTALTYTVILLAVLLFAFYTSLGGRRMLGSLAET